jgi:putative transposase
MRGLLVTPDAMKRNTTAPPVLTRRANGPAVVRPFHGGVRFVDSETSTQHPTRVRGHVGRGDKPHISFYHVRYTSERLGRTSELIGKRLRIYYDADDIRVLRAFLVDGTEFGELKAGGLWSTTPHSLDVRKRIFKAKRLRQLHFGQWDDPVQVYLNFKRGKVKRSRRAASEIAQIKDRIKAKQTSIMKPAASADPLSLAIGPVRARRLRIPSGFA